MCRLVALAAPDPGRPMGSRPLIGPRMRPEAAGGPRPHCRAAQYKSCCTGAIQAERATTLQIVSGRRRLQLSCERRRSSVRIRLVRPDQTLSRPALFWFIFFLARENPRRDELFEELKAKEV